MGRVGWLIANNGEKKGLQGELITCSGEITTELFRLGKVIVVFEFEGFITSRSNR